MRKLLGISLLLILVLAPSGFAPDARPAITGLCFVSFRVSSIEAAEKFYAKDLALPRSDKCWDTKSEECFYLTPYQNVEILRTDPPNPSSYLETIGIWTSDAAALRSYLAAKGITVSKLSSGPSGLLRFDLTDPEQHHIEFLSLTGAPNIVRESPDQISHHMIHAGFVVHDRDLIDHFYRDVLGFRLYWHGGMKDGKDDWVAMQVPDGHDWLEYMLNIKPETSQHTLGVMNHISLGVPDIHLAQEKLVKNGGTAKEDPQIGRDGKWQLNLYDPDDTRVELMEFVPKEKPCCSAFTGPHPGQ